MTTPEKRKLTLAQVLYKRKPVQYLPRPVIEDDSSEVCHLAANTYGRIA